MENKFINIKDDISRLISIFEAETEDGVDKERTIYSSKDRRLPANPIVYRHPDSVSKLENEGLIKVLQLSNSIDEKAPNFAGPPLYKVIIFAQRVKEKIQANRTVTKQSPSPLPNDAERIQSGKEFLLRFGDKKKIEFNNIDEPSAKYFLLLLDNHGLPVNHETVIGKGIASSKEKVRELKKTLVEKIEHAGLTKRVKISSKFKSAYTLLII